MGNDDKNGLDEVVVNFTNAPIEKLVRGNEADISQKLEHIFRVQFERNRDSNGKSIARSYKIRGQLEDCKTVRSLVFDLMDGAEKILPSGTTAKQVDRKHFKEMRKLLNYRLDEIRAPEKSQKFTPNPVQESAHIRKSRSGFEPRNDDQATAYKGIIDSNSVLNIITGGPGCGKSFVALRAAFNLVKNKEASQVVIIRPIFRSINDDFGFVPGELDNKMQQHTQALEDNIRKVTNETVLRLTETKQLDMFSYNDGIQGSTYHDAVMIIDDAQSIKADNIETIMTRIGGDRGKLIITGDLSGGQDTIKGESSLCNLVCGYAEDVKEHEHLMDIYNFVSFAHSSMKARHPYMDDLVRGARTRDRVRRPAFRQTERDKELLKQERDDSQKYMTELDSLTRAKYQPILKIA